MATRAAVEPRTRLFTIFIVKPPSCSLKRRLRTRQGVSPYGLASHKTAQSFRVLQPPRETRDLSEPPNGTIRFPSRLGEYACVILIIKIVYSVSYSIAGTMYPFCNGPVARPNRARRDSLVESGELVKRSFFLVLEMKPTKMESREQMQRRRTRTCGCRVKGSVWAARHRRIRRLSGVLPG